jgi:hypothetical protein
LNNPLLPEDLLFIVARFGAAVPPLQLAKTAILLGKIRGFILGCV